jgi:acyl carrier protein
MGLRARPSVHGMMTIAERVHAVIAEELGVDILSSGAALKGDLGADSMDVISLRLALEDEFTIAISDNDAEQLRTVSEVVAYIERRTAAAT